jgi:hypothetical protein
METTYYTYKSIFRNNNCIKKYDEYIQLLSSEYEVDIDNVNSVQINLFEQLLDEFLKDDIKKKFKNYIANNDEIQAFLLIKKELELNTHSEKYGVTITISGIISLFNFFEYKNILNFFRGNEKELKNSIISTLEKYKHFDTLPLYPFIPMDKRVINKAEDIKKTIDDFDLKFENYDFQSNIFNFNGLEPQSKGIDNTVKPEIPEIEFGSFDGKMVCNGAMLKCTKGGAPSTLQILPTNKIFLNSQPMAFISDTIPMVNIMPFGPCLRQSPPPPCIPNISGKWDKEISHFLSSEAAVSTNSTCKCSMGGTISIVNEGQTFMGFSKMNAKNEENSENEDNKNNETDFYYLEKEKSIEESLASKEFELNKTEYFRDKIVEEAEYWVDNLSYFKDNLIKTQKLDRTNPPPYMDEDDFVSSIYLTVLDINIGENLLMQYTRGKEVSKNSLLKGDIIFFDFDNSKEKIPDHIGIFADNNMFIHLIGNNESEKEQKVKKTSLTSNLGPALKPFSTYISKVIRIIQNDNTYYNTEIDNGDLPNIKGVKK